MAEEYKGFTIPSYPDSADAPTAFIDYTDDLAARVPIYGDTEPEGPSAGQIWFDTSDVDMQPRVWNGAEWEAMCTGVGFAEGAPLAPVLTINGNTLSWTDNPGAAGPTLAYGAVAEPADGVVVTVDSATKTAKISGTTPFTVYTFTVYGVNVAGRGRTSNAVSGEWNYNEATGGTTGEYTVSGKTYRWHRFTTSSTINVISNPQPFRALLVAGGGGGAGRQGNVAQGCVGGAGGSGGVIEKGYSADWKLATGAIPVTVGGGGGGRDDGGCNCAIQGASGGNSILSGLTAVGGGGGGGQANGVSGGSGGGGGSYCGNWSGPFGAGAGTPYQGHNGTDGGGQGSGGAGGGAGIYESGTAYSGSGRSSDITGTAVTYAPGAYGSGGGGCGWDCSGGAGAAGVVIVCYQIGGPL